MVELLALGCPLEIIKPGRQSERYLKSPLIIVAGWRIAKENNRYCLEQSQLLPGSPGAPLPGFLAAAVPACACCHGTRKRFSMRLLIFPKLMLFIFSRISIVWRDACSLAKIALGRLRHAGLGIDDNGEQYLECRDG